MQEKQFLDHLNNSLDILKSHQVEAVVVGGIALRASLGKPVEYQRSNGTTPDIDMIGLGPDKKTIDSAQGDIKKYIKDNPDSPEVGLEPVIFSDQKAEKYPALEILSGIRKDSNSHYFLTYRDLETEISPETMKPVNRNYGDVEIPTLPQETILYRYLVRMGYYKPKDLSKLQEFRQHLEKTGGDFMDPELYIPYINFATSITEQHPVLTFIGKTYWDFDKFLNGRISGSKGFIYGLIKKFRK